MSEDLHVSCVYAAIFTFLTETAQDLETQLNAHYNLLQLETKAHSTANYDAINNKYLELFNNI